MPVISDLLMPRRCGRIQSFGKIQTTICRLDPLPAWNVMVSVVHVGSLMPPSNRGSVACPEGGSGTRPLLKKSIEIILYRLVSKLPVLTKMAEQEVVDQLQLLQAWHHYLFKETTARTYYNLYFLHISSIFVSDT